MQSGNFTPATSACQTPPRRRDFLVTDAITHEKRLVQVTWEMPETATFERERSALVEARSESGIEDCMIVTWEDEREIDGGIRVIPAWKWSLGAVG